jgi:hypothetical protein
MILSHPRNPRIRSESLTAESLKKDSLMAAGRGFDMNPLGGEGRGAGAGGEGRGAGGGGGLIRDSGSFLWGPVRLFLF